MPDMRDFLALLIKHDVDFMIVGAFVLARYGIPRGTGDIDIFINPSVNNAENVLAALNEFGMASLGISVADLLSGDIIQLGFPPARIDLLTKLTGVSLEEILQSRKAADWPSLQWIFWAETFSLKTNAPWVETKTWPISTRWINPMCRKAERRLALTSWFRPRPFWIAGSLSERLLY
jgi:hypothetical protein